MLEKRLKKKDYIKAISVYLGLNLLIILIAWLIGFIYYGITVSIYDDNYSYHGYRGMNPDEIQSLIGALCFSISIIFIGNFMSFFVAVKLFIINKISGEST